MYSWLVEARDVTWQKRMEDSYKGKAPPPAGMKPDKGTFSDKNPGNIAHELKQHSKDYKQAMQRINVYVNRSGRDLLKDNKADLMDKAKDAVRQAYGKKPPAKKTTTKPAEPAQPVQPVESSPVLMPLGVPQNNDTRVLPVMSASFIGKLGAAARLRSSVLNSIQDKGTSTHISSVDEENRENEEEDEEA